MTTDSAVADGMPARVRPEVSAISTGPIPAGEGTSEPAELAAR